MLVERLTAAIDALPPQQRVLVAIDGPDAAGKTTLADALARTIARPVLRVSLDDWHNPRQVRLRRGDESPLGYYEDSFDYVGLAGRLLTPFRAGAPRVRTAQFDFRSDERAEVDVDAGTTDALVLDGVFLLRPELRGCWDLSIFVAVPPEVTLRRALERDAEQLGGPDAVRRRYERRYLPGQALYREHAQPLDHADVVVDNTEPSAPHLLRWDAKPD